MDDDRQEHLLQRLGERYRTGARLPGSSDGSIVEVRARGAGAVLLLRWTRDLRLYGVPVDLADAPVDPAAACTVEDWLDDLDLELVEAFDTGFRVWASRRRVDDYIELRDRDAWPFDRRFFVTRGEPSLRGQVESLRQDGLDPSLALTLVAEGRLLSWCVAYEDNATGHPFVGQCVVSSEDATTGRLALLETTAGVPASVGLDLAYVAAHAAAEAGALRITTDGPVELLGPAGFRTTDQGCCLDTSFLDADPRGARDLLTAATHDGDAWGRDRDIAGRPLPDGAAARLLHVLRHGPSGRPARSHVRIVAG